MKLEKQNLEGKKENIEVLDKVFASKINKKIINQVLYKINKNYKGRKAKTKQKNEIVGSTSKIYAQKGTGNARHASRKAPIFVGGGVAHGPKGQSKYKILKLNKSEKKKSIISLFSQKNIDKDLMILDNFEKEIKKTKEFSKIIKNLGVDNSLIIADLDSKKNISRSSNNLPNIKVTDYNHFSSYDLLKYKKLILTVSALKEIEKRYS